MEHRKTNHNQSDVRQGAILLATVRKAERLGRGSGVTRPLYQNWNSFSGRFHSEHALVADINELLRADSTITKEIKVPK